MSDNNNDIFLIDENNFLKLYSYKTCTNEDISDKKNQRGIIKSIDENIIAKSLPYTDEYTILNKNDVLFNDNIFIYPSIEGSLIRIFNHQSTWYITTNRKLDAFKSYWSSKLSFGQLFVNELCKIYKEDVSTILESFFKKLDENYIYFFLLPTNSENRIVCHNKKIASLYYIGCYSKENQDVLLNHKIDILSDIPVFEPIQLNKDDIFDYVEEKIDPYEYQGLIVFEQDTNHQIKILNSDYKYYWSIRNNNPNLLIRYLELRNNDPEKLKLFFQLYPRFVYTSDNIENQIFDLSKIIYDAYIERYIKKKYISLPKQEYIILKKAHDWHNEDRHSHKIYRNKILSLLNQEKPFHLYQMLKRFRLLNS